MMTSGKANWTGGIFGKVRRVHFVGVGGIGMSGIAEVLLNLGFDVSGSDIRASRTTGRLETLGCRFFPRHAPENVEKADVVVVSSAITADNIEVARAHELQIPVIRRAEMLGELMRLKYSVTVAGSHGKTTTTSMISVLLHHCGLDPTIVIGGRLNIFGSNARLGQGPLLVAEADESDGSFLKLFPTMAVITNIDAEHMDFYGTMDGLKQTFLDYINRIPFYGLAILCLDDANVASIIPHVQRRYLTYGFSTNADLTADIISQEEGGSRFQAVFQNRNLGEFRLRVPGTYNILNSLSAIAAGLELSVPADQIREGLIAYEGVDRRFQLLGEVAGIRVIDDYGHHPTEIRATLEAARALSPRRILAVFQPHRYSRVSALWEEFATAFGDADLVFCADIYPAGEKPLADITGERLHEAIRASGGDKPVHFEPDFQQLADRIAAQAAPGDMIITFGAGNIYEVGHLVLDRLQKEA
jgi:UDP-N-acetylmuramate--alanine ligase